jgi:hypothetical protein
MPLRSVVLAGLAIAMLVLGVLAPQTRAAVPANGRGWELLTVNPPSSSRILGLRALGDDGERLIYGALGPPDGSSSGAMTAVGASIRGPLGWSDAPIGIPYRTEVGASVLLLAPVLPVAFAADEETTLWLSTNPLTPGAPPEPQLSLYRELPGGTLQFIAKVATNAGTPESTVEYQRFSDISSDGSRVVFATDEHVVPGDAGRTQGESIYTWNGSSVQLVDVDGGGSLLSTCGSTISDANGMSASGERVFFTIAPQCGHLEEVYLANLKTGSKVKISESLCTRVDCNADADVTFAGATSSGNFAYLTTTQQLTNADEDTGRDLYRYNVGSAQLTLVSGAASAVTGEVVNQLVFPSEGGERVYFRATGEIIPGESTPGEKLFMADSGGVHLVAVASFPASAEVQLSANGGRALFVTETKIGADTDSQGDAFLYDAAAGSLTRLSTGPAGGNGEQAVRIAAPAPVDRHEFEFGNTRPYYAITGAGDRAFFQTDESLLAEDTNGVADVYEWTNGQLGLVSPGNQPLRSDFGGASRDGRTVVFATNASLVGRDNDGESRDLYAARLEGGFAEPSPAPGCDASSCPVPAKGRIVRPFFTTMGKPKSKGGALRVIEVASKAKKGAIAVVVSAPKPGLVSGQIWTQSKGKKVVLAAGSTRAKRAGKTELKLKLTRSARSATGGGAKSAQLTVKQGSSTASQTVKVSLR